ncbi:Aste57867_2150 [Aphanomyces stellatus]|uniref:Aste57867_2150 protein n=1 Tax=Aphanomyces stellatus TaxID=120398 RepID=A0A485K7Z0_9STRA|nr:hypothetical protein As57867_002145 [Aphanomyces stellatus]VFT79353.1 Aste57867_2150 [Aphanomyces stellatus]
MAGDSGAHHVGSYSPATGFIFIFNIIVGTGALTIPHEFARVGLFYGAAALFVLSLVSYIAGTYMVEAIAGVNALHVFGTTGKVCAVEVIGGVQRGPLNETAPLLASAATKVDEDDYVEGLHFDEVPEVDAKDESVVPAEVIEEEYVAGLHFDISKKVEMAAMAHELFSPRGLIAFYVCVIAYLYGDLSIYAVAIPKSLREVICPRPSMDQAVWDCPYVHMNSAVLYRVLVVVFGIALGPFAMGHMHKTACIQIATTIMRHISFTLMIVLAGVGISSGQGRPTADIVAYENLSYVPNFFGICIYSFMCHHSLPGIIAPISTKRSVRYILASAFIAVFVLYIVLACSATFRFRPEDIQDVYTLNFFSYPNAFIAYFLSLFPVFTLGTTFPIICITLRENLRTLFHTNPVSHLNDLTFFGLLAVGPPLVVALCTDDVGMLVVITGAYAGLGIQWIIPAAFVYTLRVRLQAIQAQLNLSAVPKNPYASAFGGLGWLVVLMMLSAASLIIVTYTRVFK